VTRDPRSESVASLRFNISYVQSYQILVVYPSSFFRCLMSIACCFILFFIHFFVLRLYLMVDFDMYCKWLAVR